LFQVNNTWPNYLTRSDQKFFPKYVLIAFAARFIIYYFLFYFVWNSFYLYWEIPLFYICSTICNSLFHLPLELPVIDHNGKIFVRLLDLLYYPKSSFISHDILPTLSLILSTSNIKISNRIKMIILSIFFLFLIQSFLATYDTYYWILKNYDLWVEKRIPVFQIIDIKKIDKEFYIRSSRYLIGFIKLIPFLLWTVLVFIYKKGSQLNMPWKLI
jgi:hypothetical protein